MDRRERELIIRQGVVLPETPLERREREGLQQDVEESPLKGKPLRQRLRNFRARADAYLAALGGPRPYMLRLRAIENEIAEHERQLAEAQRALAGECVGDARAFARRWRETAERWSFDEVNDLIERHNRFYPAESSLPMDPRTGDFVRVSGERYVKRPLDAAWILERFPPKLPA